jgi:hypothetical protein
MTDQTLHLDRLTEHSFQAWQEGTDLVLVVRETTDGWRTEGNQVFEGLLFPTLDALVAHLEGRN